MATLLRVRPPLVAATPWAPLLRVVAALVTATSVAPLLRVRPHSLLCRAALGGALDAAVFESIDIGVRQFGEGIPKGGRS